MFLEISRISLKGCFTNVLINSDQILYCTIEETHNSAEINIHLTNGEFFSNIQIDKKSLLWNQIIELKKVKS